MDIYITVDTEVWPVHAGRWPHEPLSSSSVCELELDAYFVGSTATGKYGLPYQLEMLKRHGLKATFFVDPLFSFALGLESLKMVVSLIEARGQYVGLHLHPEWLTDPRCEGLPQFRGPMLWEYPLEDQARLLQIGWARLVEAGARPVPAFRAGSFAADVTTLGLLPSLGIRVDSSLNSPYGYSFPTFKQREQLQDPTLINGVVELPVSRFLDGVTRGGRPLSMVGVSAAEMEFVLDDAHQAGRTAVVLVLHSNEFVRTQRLWVARSPNIRRLIAGRFERFCGFLSRNDRRFTTQGAHECEASSAAAGSSHAVPQSTVVRTIPRVAGQIISRWY